MYGDHFCLFNLSKTQFFFAADTVNFITSNMLSKDPNVNHSPPRYICLLSYGNNKNM